MKAALSATRSAARSAACSTALTALLSVCASQDREADRDLWEQRTERFQMLMTVSSLLISGGFALAVEGQLPSTPGCLDDGCQLEVLAVDYLHLASSLLIASDCF